VSSMKEFADNLQRDVVSEMAEHYFGARRDLEKMIEVIDQWVGELKQMEKRVLAAAGRLHHLLLEDEVVREFYIALDILPSCVPPYDSSPPEPVVEKVPFAFTLKGRWTKCVRQAYAKLQAEVDEYLNGRYFSDEQGRKRLTLHYLRLKAMTEYVNDQVERVNKDLAPSEALRYIRNMDSENLSKEKFVDPCVPEEGCGIDDQLRFRPFDFHSFGLLEIQDLPHPDKVSQDIAAFCDAVYARRKDEIRQLMGKL